jgi:hygromycin-B 4-O-kinase
VRLSTAIEKLEDFKKEQWTIQKVSELGIPVAEIVDVGDQVIEFPYMVQKKVEGTEALYHPNKKKVLNQMGEITARINTIKTKGFGKRFDWSKDEGQKNTSWAEFLEKELELDKRLQLFLQHGMLTKESVKKLKITLESLVGTRSRTMLNHGDMRRKNVLVNESADVVAIIDWEESCSNIAPTWDLSIALHDL